MPCYNSQNLVKCLKMSAEIVEKRADYKNFNEQLDMCLNVAGCFGIGQITTQAKIDREKIEDLLQALVSPWQQFS